MAEKVMFNVPPGTTDALNDLVYDIQIGCIPPGAKGRFLKQAIEFFNDHESLNLKQFGFKDSDVIYGSPETIRKIETVFRRSRERL